MRASPRFVIAFALLALLGGVWPRPAASAAASPAHAAQEFSLGSLGVAAQTLHGIAPSLTVSFPPPALGVAGSGSYLRVFFGHSSAAAAGSTLTVSAGRTRINAVPLSAGTAAGSVFLVPIPRPLLGNGGPTLTTFAFALHPVRGATADELFGRLDADTAIHYELGAEVGTLEAHPFSLLGGLLAGSLAGTSLAVLLPAHPDPAELGAALRLVADSARLLRPAPLRLTVVEGGTSEALSREGSPALVVGRLAGLPGIDQLARAAGFTRSGGTWRAPGGRSAGDDDGLLMAVVSPWDHSSPLVVVTGGSDAAVVKATDALLAEPRIGVAGHAAVVNRIPAAPVDLPAASLAPLPGGVDLAGGGDQVIAFGAAALTPEPLVLRLAATSPVSISARLNDGVEQVIDLPGASNAVQLRTGTTRPGINGLVIDVRVPAGVAVHLEASAFLTGAGAPASQLSRLAPPCRSPPPGVGPRSSTPTPSSWDRRARPWASDGDWPRPCPTRPPRGRTGTLRCWSWCSPRHRPSSGWPATRPAWPAWPRRSRPGG